MGWVDELFAVASKKGKEQEALAKQIKAGAKLPADQKKKLADAYVKLDKELEAIGKKYEAARKLDSDAMKAQFKTMGIG